MTWSFPIGRLFGTEIRVHVTFLLLLAWIGLATAMAEGTETALRQVLLVLALFACVVAHEFGHALMARRYGIATADVTLLPIGGVARLERMPEDPRQEIAVALAGPAVNVVIWAALTVVFGWGQPLAAFTEGGGAQGFAAELASVNLMLAVFNLIPAFPLDGGRVLRAVLATATDRVRATRLAAMAGQTLALVLGFLGLIWGNPLLVLIAVFVFVAAAAESNDVAMRSAARGYLARDAMITQFESLGPEDTLDAAAQALIRTTQHEFPVVDPEGRLTGFLTRTALFRALAEENRTQKVAAAMSTGIPAVSVLTGLEAALDAMQKAQAPAIGVVGREGRLVGYITPENLGELMLLANARMRR